MEVYDKRMDFGLLLLRLSLGSLFIYSGIIKLLNTEQTVLLLEGIGFPLPAIFARVLLLSEIIFGLSVLAGYRVNITVWPLIIIPALGAAIIYLPEVVNGLPSLDLFFHFIIVAALLTVYLGGAGRYSLDFRRE
jgi:putative oxidoreductase